jgi:hypothetical protein
MGVQAVAMAPSDQRTAVAVAQQARSERSATGFAGSAEKARRETREACSVPRERFRRASRNAPGKGGGTVMALIIRGV